MDNISIKFQCADDCNASRPIDLCPEVVGNIRHLFYYCSLNSPSLSSPVSETLAPSQSNQSAGEIITTPQEEEKQAHYIVFIVLAGLSMLLLSFIYCRRKRSRIVPNGGAP